MCFAVFDQIYVFHGDWHHFTETISAQQHLCEDDLPITCWFPSQRPVMEGVDVFFVSLNKQ